MYTRAHVFNFDVTDRDEHVWIDFNLGKSVRNCARFSFDILSPFLQDRICLFFHLAAVEIFVEFNLLYGLKETYHKKSLI